MANLRQNWGIPYMNINPAAAYRAYNKINGYSHSSRHTEFGVEDAAQRLENTDQIEIRPEGARKMEAEQLTKAIAAELREPASPEKLNELREAIQNKSYHVPTGDLVNAMMRHCALV